MSGLGAGILFGCVLALILVFVCGHGPWLSVAMALVEAGRRVGDVLADAVKVGGLC